MPKAKKNLPLFGPMSLHFPPLTSIILHFIQELSTVGPRYNVIGYNGHSVQQSRFLGPNETFSIVFYLVITDLQYNSQNAEVPMGPKPPGPTVSIL